jgi:hypothetical protein
LSKPPAKRARCDQEGKLHIALEQRLCVVGRHLKQNLCPPSCVVDNVQLFRVGAKDAWLTQMIAGRVKSEELSGTVRCLRATLARLAKGGADSPDARASQDSEAVATLKALQDSRVAMGLESDSDADEQEENAVQVQARAARKKGKQGVVQSPLKTVSLRGTNFRIATVNKLLWVEATQEAVSAIADEMAAEVAPLALRKEIIRQEQEERAARSARDVQRAHFSHQREAPRVPYIHFSQTREAWFVSYISDGKRCGTSTGLDVPSKYPETSERIPETQYVETLNKKHIEAQRLWNRKDNSGRGKFFDGRCVEECGAGSPEERGAGSPEERGAGSPANVE